MKISLRTQSIGDYHGKKTLGHSLASQDIYMIDMLNRVLADAMQERGHKCQRFMDYMLQRALIHQISPDKKPFTLDDVSMKAWQLCYDNQHPVLGLAVLRQMRAEAFMVQMIKEYDMGREIHDQIDHIVSGHADLNLGVGLHVNGQPAGEPTKLYHASMAQLEEKTPDAYWYHNECLHVPYAAEVNLPFVAAYLLAKGYAIKAVEKYFCDVVLGSASLRELEIVGRHVEHERHRHLLEQFQVACVWLTGYRNGQQGLKEGLAQEAYNELHI